jgi:DNA polymerase gamma 1
MMLKNVYKRPIIQSRVQTSLRFLASKPALRVKHEPPRSNQVGIQMINDNLRDYLFKESLEPGPDQVQKALEHLKNFNLNQKKSETQKDVENLELPMLRGKNIAEHFTNIGRKQTQKYMKLISQLINNDLPPMPQNFEFQSGWTR